MNPAHNQKQLPNSDPQLPYPYDSKTISMKKKNKMDFLKDKKENPFTIAFFSDHLTASEEKICTTLLEGISSLSSIRILLIGEQQRPYAHCSFLDIRKLGYAFAIADSILLFPSQTKTLFSEILMGMRYGVIPIVPMDGKTKNIILPFDPVGEKGNGFLFQKGDLWNMFEAIVRAKENYRFPYDWENIMRSCMEN